MKLKFLELRITPGDIVEAPGSYKPPLEAPSGGLMGSSGRLRGARILSMDGLVPKASRMSGLASAYR